jgi:hypothetical protein
VNRPRPIREGGTKRFGPRVHQDSINRKKCARRQGGLGIEVETTGQKSCQRNEGVEGLRTEAGGYVRTHTHTF